jgi:hypothetical protein
MLLRLLAECPQEVLFLSLVGLKTVELIRTSLTCAQLLRLLFVDDLGNENAPAMLQTLSKGTRMHPQMYCCNTSELSGQVHLGSSGIPLRICGQYFRAMQNVKLVEVLLFRSAEDILALISAHRQLSKLAEALGKKALQDGNGRGDRQYLSIGPPVGSLLHTGESWFAVDFQVSVHEGIPACSEWHWLDVPRLTARCGSAIASCSQQAQTLFRVGVQLQADVATHACHRPELRCAVAAPTKSWVVLHAVAADPGASFEVGLAAGGFHAYGREEDGWYFPREECSWRSSKQCRRSRSMCDITTEEQDADSFGNEQVSMSVRMILRVCSASRSSRVRRSRLRSAARGSA